MARRTRTLKRSKLINPPRRLAKAAQSKDDFVYRMTCTKDEELLFEIGQPALEGAPGDMHPLVLQISLEQLAIQHLSRLLDSHINKVREAMPENLMFQEGMPGMPGKETDPDA